MAFVRVLIGVATIVGAVCVLARKGNPSTPALTGWPEYRPDQRYPMVLSPDVKTIREDREVERGIWADDLLE